MSVVTTLLSSAGTCTLSSYATRRRSSRPLTSPPMSYLVSFIRTLLSGKEYRRVCVTLILCRFLRSLRYTLILLAYVYKCLVMLVFYTCTCAQVRTFNVEKTKNMRMLNPEDIDHLITISGMVIRTSPLIPEMREAFFR